MLQSKESHCLEKISCFFLHNLCIFSLGCNPFFEIWISKSLRRKSYLNQLGLAWPKIAGLSLHIHRQIENITIQIQEALWRKLNNLKVNLAAMKKFTFQKRSKKMLSTHIRGQIMQTRNKTQKLINMRVTTSQYETSSKNNAHLFSHNLPHGEKIHWNKQ